MRYLPLALLQKIKIYFENTSGKRRAYLLTLATFFSVFPAWAINPPAPTNASSKVFRQAELTIDHQYQTVNQLPEQAADRAQQALAALGVSVDAARIDRRGGRFATLLPAQPLIPGTGVGNRVQWSDLQGSPPGNDAARKGAAWKAFAGYLQANAEHLNVNLGELPSPGRVTLASAGDIVQIYAQRTINGVPVRDTYITAVINHGNLVLFGTQNWGDLNVSTEPGIGLDKARAAVAKHLQGLPVNGEWDNAELVIVPLARGRDVAQVALGQGYNYRLVWVVRPQITGDQGHYEALVDARSGALLSFQDTNHYAEAISGVYPVTNDGVAPDGVEQPGWPLPFLNISTSSGTQTTDTGGNLPGVSGSLNSNLEGPYVLMNDNCGAISLTQSDNLDFGTSAGTDCTTPGIGGAGNTHASRTGFYELNRIAEMARGQLPSNIWLTQQLTANMNINNTCNAYWNGEVNFYRSGGGCSNTGEIAGVFDHEWGHGLDDNDANPNIASPSGEGIADIYMALRLNNSCIGRNFRPGVQCNIGYPAGVDSCTSCTGVRDIDYQKHQSGQPHTYSWSNSNCLTGQVHCVGHVYSEAVWSLWKRKLPSLYGYDNNTAHEIVNRLTYIGAGNTGTWFSGSPPYGGCAGGSGYMNYLAADDDNGNLNDGTPHMQAIYEAFNDQQIACQTPAVQDAGCSGVPTIPPGLNATAAANSVDLSWGTVTGASKYQVFRSEGVFACDFGKVKIGETTGTTWTDSGLQNGRNYSYIVLPIGSSNACMGPASSCASATPAPGPGVTVNTGSASQSLSGGDADTYLDNCEDGTLSFTVTNTGLGGLSNVRIVGVTPSNAGVTVNTSFPAALSPSTLSEGQTANGSFSYTAGGLSFGETLTFQVEVMADEMGASKFADLTVSQTETDWGPVGTYTFEASGNDGWQVVEGTFNRANSGGGGNSTSWYMRSSSSLDNQCDRIRSPEVKLSDTSTLTLWTNFDIEPYYSGNQGPQGWYDRATVGVYDPATSWAAVNPDSGRQYNASGNGANYDSCGLGGQNGWADAMSSWASSGWSSAALNASIYADRPVQLEIRYGTDTSLKGDGFRFDEVTLTNAQVQVADIQSNTCNGPSAPVCNDGTLESPEVCESNNLNGESCESLGFANGGALACAGDCLSFDTSGCIGEPVCGDGFCDGGAGENCNTCSADCGSLPIPGSVCGNGLCEAGDGENCVSCPADCAGVQNGPPSGRYCCGANGGKSPVGCDANLCGGEDACTFVPTGPSGSTCCGDGQCQSPEDASQCGTDCGSSGPTCGDGIAEDPELCDGSDLRGATCESETGGNQPYGSLACAFDCNSYNTSGCSSTPPSECTIGLPGDACTSNAGCCSEKCTGKPGAKTCK